MVLTLHIELHVGDAGITESVVGRADVVPGVVAGHFLEDDGVPPDGLLAAGHAALLPAPHDLGVGGAAGDLALEGHDVAGAGHDDAGLGDNADLGAN